MNRNAPSTPTSHWFKTLHSAWALGAIVILAFIGAVSMSGTSNAANGSLDMHLNSPPVSPIETPSPLPTPTPAPPSVRRVQPPQGINTRIVRINIYGSAFQQGSRVFLFPAGSAIVDPSTTLPTGVRELRAIRVSRHQIMAKVPAGLTPGYYDVVVKNPGISGLGVLEEGYRALSGNPNDTDDLSAEPFHLWTSPDTLRLGEEALIGLRVHRLGGVSGLPPFRVNFYVNEIDPEHFLGQGTVPGISPDGFASTSGVSWTPDEGGAVTLIAVIDPENQIRESNERNNVVRRKVVVRRLPQTDTTPPVASNLQVNGGVDEVTDPEVTFTVDGTDPGQPSSGVKQVFYVELQWLEGIGSGQGIWYPVKWSDWLPFAQQPHDWTLYPTSGLRYLQAWIADGAGNVSARPARTLLSYLPGTDEVDQGETQVYRKAVAANRCLTVRVEPTASSMDPDLYVWFPSYQPGNGQFAYSINGAGQVDQVVIQPTEAGVYQIEVDGFTDASYGLTVQVTDSCSTAAGLSLEQASANAGKTPRNEPDIPVNEEPGDDVMAPDAPAEYAIFLPAAMRASSGGGQGPYGSHRIYLPSVLR